MNDDRSDKGIFPADINGETRCIMEKLRRVEILGVVPVWSELVLLLLVCLWG